MHRISTPFLMRKPRKKSSDGARCGEPKKCAFMIRHCFSRFKYYPIFCGVGAISDTLPQTHASSAGIISGYGDRPHPGLF